MSFGMVERLMRAERGTVRRVVLACLGVRGVRVDLVSEEW